MEKRNPIKLIKSIICQHCRYISSLRGCFILSMRLRFLTMRLYPRCVTEAIWNMASCTMNINYALHGAANHPHHELRAARPLILNNTLISCDLHRSQRSLLYYFEEGVTSKVTDSHARHGSHQREQARGDGGATRWASATRREWWHAAGGGVRWHAAGGGTLHNSTKLMHATGDIHFRCSEKIWTNDLVQIFFISLVT